MTQALLLAARAGELEAVRAELDGGADASCADETVRSAFCGAPRRLCPARPASLTCCRAQVANTPLHWAASFGHLAVVRLLLEREADVNARNSLGLAPLARAAWKGELGVAALLLRHGADVHARNNVRGPLARLSSGPSADGRAMNAGRANGAGCGQDGRDERPADSRGG